MSDIVKTLGRIEERMEALEKRIEAVVIGRLDKEWYTTEEVAVMLKRAPWTIRQHCLAGRIRARKRAGTDRWLVSREELERVMNEGLLKPVRK